MKKISKIFLLIFLLALSAYAGMEYMNLKYSLNQSPLQDETIPLAKIFHFENVNIPSKNFTCEGTKDQKVGTILSFILTAALNEKETRLSYSCNDDPHSSRTNCSLILSCGFFKISEECSSRILSFTATQNTQILPDSFSCADLP